ncbi:hypothetical protein VNO77_19741 [Canavalia gladiata]|uniref:Uncharacterized protein n=1 Tax=Canavalia gladiata TaxID=3824 RepID=A0AAN9LT54_CANGL
MCGGPFDFVPLKCVAAPPTLIHSPELLAQCGRHVEQHLDEDKSYLMRTPQSQVRCAISERPPGRFVTFCPGSAIGGDGNLIHGCHGGSTVSFRLSRAIAPPAPANPNASLYVAWHLCTFRHLFGHLLVHPWGSVVGASSGSVLMQVTL